MARVVRCSRSSLATWLRSLRCVASRSPRVSRSASFCDSIRASIWLNVVVSTSNSPSPIAGARTLKSPRSETALAVSVSESTGREIPAWKMRDRKYATSSEATIAAAAIAPHNQNLAYSALVSARRYKVPRRRLGPSLTGSNPSRRPALKLYPSAPNCRGYASPRVAPAAYVANGFPSSSYSAAATMLGSVRSVASTSCASCSSRNASAAVLFAETIRASVATCCRLSPRVVMSS